MLHVSLSLLAQKLTLWRTDTLYFPWNKLPNINVSNTKVSFLRLIGSQEIVFIPNLGTTCVGTEILCSYGVSVLTNGNTEGAAEVLNSHGKRHRKANAAQIPVTLSFLFWTSALKHKWNLVKERKIMWKKEMVNLLRLLVLREMKDFESKQIKETWPERRERHLLATATYFIIFIILQVHILFLLFTKWNHLDYMASQWIVIIL